MAKGHSYTAPFLCFLGIFTGIGVACSEPRPTMHLLRQAQQPATKFDRRDYANENTAAEHLAPVTDLLGDRLKSTFEVRSAVSYEHIIEEIKGEAKPEVILLYSPNLVKTGLDNGYVYVAPVMTPYRAVLAARQDLQAQHIGDLQASETTISLALRERGSTSGYVAPMAALHQSGFTRSNIELVEVGAIDAILDGVAEGQYTLGGVALGQLDTYIRQKELKILWISDLLPTGGMLIRGDLVVGSSLSGESLRQALLSLPESVLGPTRLNPFMSMPDYEVLTKFHADKQAFISSGSAEIETE